MRKYLAVLLLIVMATSFSLTVDEHCRFAHEYYTEDLIANRQITDQFLRKFIKWQANFIRKVGVDSATGLTLDGIRIDVHSGELLPDSLHRFTASSKECIHLGIMAKVMEDAKFANQIYDVKDVFRIVQQKVQTLQKFYKKYPGYAGFLPWVYVNGTEPSPTYDFVNRVPALDNGEMFWAALSLSLVWKQKYPNVLPQIRERFDKVYWKMMITNARKVFFNETTGKIRAVANIMDMYSSVENNIYSNDDDYYLDDPYEGEMFTWIITLLAKDQFSQAQIEAIWKDKRGKLQSVDYTVKSKDQTQITVEKGWWFSSHQQWKNLFLPYYLSPTYKRIQINNQKARIWHSVDIKIPGLYGAMAGPAQQNDEDTGYFVAGIEQISFQNVTFDSLVTPYGAFPLLLVNKEYGAAWLHNTIYSPCGQTQYGSLQGTGLNGSLMSPTLTWDTKITAALAVMNGTRSIIQKYLDESGLLQQFVGRIEKEYALAFPSIKGENVPFTLPNIQIRRGRPDFTTCS